MDIWQEHYRLTVLFDNIAGTEDFWPMLAYAAAAVGFDDKSLDRAVIDGVHPMD